MSAVASLVVDTLPPVVVVAVSGVSSAFCVGVSVIGAALLLSPADDEEALKFSDLLFL